MTRKTISIDEDLHGELSADKREDESWTECIRRLVDESPGQQAECDVNALTEDHIEDIAAITARKAADEVETRLR